MKTSILTRLLGKMPELMRANIDDDIDYNPEDELQRYITEEVLVEVDYGLSTTEENPYSKEELEDLKTFCQELLTEL